MAEDKKKDGKPKVAAAPDKTEAQGNKIKPLEAEIYGDEPHDDQAAPQPADDHKLHVLTDDDEEEISASSRVMLYVILLFFAVFVVWANFATVDEVTRGMGKVIPSSQVQVMQSLEGGIIEEFLVREGDIVETGQPVIRLRDVAATSDLQANKKRYYSLQAKAIRLQAEADGGEQPVFNEELMQEVPRSVQEEIDTYTAHKLQQQSQIQVLERQREQKRREIDEMESRIKDLKGVIRLSKEEIDLIEPLVQRGSAPRVELLQLERALKEQEAELNSVRQSLPRATAAVEEAQARMEEVLTNAQAQAQSDLAATMIELNSIEESLTGLEDRQDRMEMRSPVTGTVKDIKVSTVGGVIGPGEDLIEIVPIDEQLLVEAQIRPQDIAFLHPGQKTIIKITAYDYSIYGGLDGELVDISADTIMDERGEAFYRVRIKADEMTLNRNGKILPIIPGMVASVDILTGKKTIMQYIMKPIFKTFGEAMSER